MWSRHSRRRLAAGAIAAGLILAAISIAARAAGPSRADAVKRPHATMRAPALQSPADELASGLVPTFSWGAVKGAAAYEFQLSADGAFRSIVLGQGNGSFQTKNTAATINKTLADGSYFWRVRGLTSKGHAGPWSRTRTLRKTWSAAPTLTSPSSGTAINYPQPVILSWSAVPRAFKYSVEVATDPSLSAAAPGFSKAIETSGTDFAIPLAFPPGRYYWAITPLDAQKTKGARSAVGSFDLAWPSATTTRIADLNEDDRVYDPQLSWDAVPGAARYEVEVSSSDEFAPGSKVCCSDPTTGTSLSPRKVLPNNTGTGGGYFWRVRAIDVDGNAGRWNPGPSFPKYFSPTSIASIPHLHMRDHTTDLPATGTPAVNDPVVAWDPAPGAASYEAQVAPTTRFATTFGSASGTTIAVASTASMIPGLTVEFDNPNGTVFALRRIVSITDATHLLIDSALPSPSPAVGAPVTYSSGFCNWTPTSIQASELWSVRTAATAWTPMSPGFNTVSPVGRIFANVSYDPGRALVDGHSYCVRVRARGDRDADLREVVSAWTELGDFLGRKPSFEYDEPPALPCSGQTAMQASDYDTPAHGMVTGRLPFFAWKRVPCAASYYVVVAKDESFTDVIDLALTRSPEYAPRNFSDARTYPDESSSYYWAVIPAPAASGGGVWSTPQNNAPQQFQKRSVPPTLISPVGSAGVSEQPTFRWTAAEGAREYRLQVAQDPTFGDPIEDVLTDATAYTTASTYPADTALYWRVRANDESRIGLAWSAVETFTRRLPAPEPSAENPTGGRTIPLLTWTPVAGAVSYDLHVDQPDGTQRDFNLRSAAFTPLAHYGTGVWQWKVRANFPKMPFGSTPGAYSGRQPFTRFIGAPAGTRGVANSTRMVLSWDPVEMAKSYKVEISQSNSFSSTIENQTTDNTSYAPKLTHPGFADGGPLYWRVAGVDEGNNVGGFTSGTFALPKRIKLVLTGSLRKGKRGAIKVKVMDARGRLVSKAKVRVAGAGLRALAKRTTKRGTTVFNLRPSRKGSISFQASKGGYRKGSAILKVGL
jgi:hypothetical protein